MFFPPLTVSIVKWDADTAQCVSRLCWSTPTGVKAPGEDGESERERERQRARERGIDLNSEGDGEVAAWEKSEQTEVERCSAGDVPKREGSDWISGFDQHSCCGVWVVLKCCAFKVVKASHLNKWQDVISWTFMMNLAMSKNIHTQLLVCRLQW